MIKIKIPEKANLRVFWEDKAENYTQQRRKKVESYFKNKYKVKKVNVIFKPTKINEKTGKIEIDISENIMDEKLFFYLTAQSSNNQKNIKFNHQISLVLHKDLIKFMSLKIFQSKENKGRNHNSFLQINECLKQGAIQILHHMLFCFLR